MELPTADLPGIAECSVARRAEVVASTVVESGDDCEVRPQGVEVPEFVFRDRIQQRAFEQLAGCSEVEEKSVKVLFCVPRQIQEEDCRAVR